MGDETTYLARLDARGIPLGHVLGHDYGGGVGSVGKIGRDVVCVECDIKKKDAEVWDCNSELGGN